MRQHIKLENSKMEFNAKFLAAACVAGAIMTLPVQAAQARTLEAVKEKGNIVCGVSTGLPGFSFPDSSGEWAGLDVDFCRAVSAAIFGDPTRVTFTPLTAKERFTALQSGEVDVLSRNSTYTMSRDTIQGLNFAGVTYYDGQGFMVRKDLNVSDIKELDGASICIQSGTTTELNVSDYFRTNGMSFEPVVFDSPENSAVAFASGRCDVLTTDQSQLSSLRSRFENPEEFVLLPNVISKEPLGPMVRHGDDQWFDIITWVRNAMFLAEEFGLTKDNVDEMKNSENPEIKRFLGLDGDHGASLGLDNDWAYNIVKMVGNYGESFSAHIGPGSILDMDRGYNRLWTDGGLHYAYPIR